VRRRSRDSQPRRNSTRWRVRTPTIIQMDALECGAASLAIVMAYYRKFVALEELRVACGVSRNGSRADRIVAAAAHYGFTVRACRMGVASILALGKPAIIFWNFNHFVVVEGFRGQIVYLNDPATGPRKATIEEFDRGFTGVTLIIQPKFTKQRARDPRSLSAALLRRVRGCWSAVAYLGLVAAGIAISGIALPLFAKIFIDDIVRGHTDLGWARSLVLGVVATAVIRALLGVMQQSCLLQFRRELSTKMAGTFTWHLLRLPLDFFKQRFPSEIANRIRLNDEVAQAISGELSTAALDCLMVALYGALLFLLDLDLALIVFAAAIVNFTLLNALSHLRIAGKARMVVDRSKVYETAINAIINMETVKASGLEPDVFMRWSGFQTRLINSTQRLETATLPLLIGVPAFSSLAITAVILFGGWRVVGGQMTIGELIAFQSLAVSFLTPVNNLVMMGSRIQEMHIAIERLDDVLRSPVENSIQFSRDRERPAGLRKLDGGLELKGVTFGYSRLGEPLIRNFSCVLRPGTRVALVGPTGSGKSTVARLIMGLYQPWEGSILFDGRPCADIPREEWLNSVALVEQEISIFDGTIYDNLTLWRTTVPPERVMQATEDACIHENFVACRQGYRTHLFSGAGSGLSGGERQRLEIARALAGDPSLLILDEATSALDSRTEDLINTNIRQRGITCLVVAHRLSTIRDCDEIIVLDAGAVVERGKHADLMHNHGLYSRLVMTM
jgi:ATP-binding cassette subfamily C protein